MQLLRITVAGFQDSCCLMSHKSKSPGLGSPPYRAQNQSRRKRYMKKIQNLSEFVVVPWTWGLFSLFENYINGRHWNGFNFLMNRLSFIVYRSLSMHLLPILDYLYITLQCNSIFETLHQSFQIELQNVPAICAIIKCAVVHLYPHRNLIMTFSEMHGICLTARHRTTI